MSLKNTIGTVFITALFAFPAQAQAPAAPQPPAQERPGAPVQADTIETSHGQAPTKPMSYYNYAHDEAEYSVSLPEAPTVSTIWRESPETKAFLKRPPTDQASLGEKAIFKIVDTDTEEAFEAQITFMRASPVFLSELTEAKIRNMLSKSFGEVTLSNETFTISSGTGSLKWATLSGFVLDSHHHPAFYALHYLTGLQSILVVQTKYSIENKTFEEYYKHLVGSITYVQP